MRNFKLYILMLIPMFSCNQKENSKCNFCHINHDFNYNSVVKHYEANCLEFKPEKLKSESDFKIFEISEDVPFCLLNFTEYLRNKYIISTNNKRTFFISKFNSDTIFNVYDDEEYQYIYPRNCQIEIVFSKSTNLFFCFDDDPLCGLDSRRLYKKVITYDGKSCLQLERDRIVLNKFSNDEWYSEEYPIILTFTDYSSIQRIIEKVCANTKKKKIRNNQINIFSFLGI